MLISFIVRKIREANAPSQPPTNQPGHQDRSPQQYGQQPGYPPSYDNAQVQHNYPPNTASEPSTWQRWLPRIKLVAAVILPVILETLDYTGKLVAYT
jgi:hypothetical protein